jgi:uncharacterized protein YukE
MAVNITVSAEDWQATAAEFAGENMRLRAALQAAGRELNQLASAVDGEEAGSPPGDDPNDDESPGHIAENKE